METISAGLATSKAKIVKIYGQKVRQTDRPKNGLRKKNLNAEIISFPKTFA